MLLVLDNPAGHKTPEFVCWLFDHGVMPLYTPVGGSWLNMAESLQRILKRRALDGQYPTETAQIILRRRWQLEEQWAQWCFTKAPATSSKCDTNLPASLSFRTCVISLGALSTNWKSAGTAPAHACKTETLGMP